MAHLSSLEAAVIDLKCQVQDLRARSLAPDPDSQSCTCVGQKRKTLEARLQPEEYQYSRVKKRREPEG